MTVELIRFRDRRAERHEATRAEILAAAWELVRAEGLAALTLRDLAAKVGMRPPSLYSYFASKNAIYDAMFLQGNLELLRRCESAPELGKPVDALRWCARTFVEFGIEDPARAQLLFLRTIPGFEPSAETYAVAKQVLALSTAQLERIGIPARFMDLWTGVVSGLMWQQIANEPGGGRWARLVDDAVDMFLAHVKRKERQSRARRRT
jgi:AcrR family transcriptional regulator